MVANRVRTLDGRWRTLDSKTLHQYVVALSELHEGVLQVLLTDRLGYAWDERARQHSPVPRFDIAGVPDELIGEFARARGRHPSPVEVVRLQQATLQTRPGKQHIDLAEQTAGWRRRATSRIAADPGDTAG
jgi:hypothetical protein